MKVNATKLGTGITGLGLGLFGIPATLAINHVQSPSWLTSGCMVAGLVITLIGHFVTASFASAVDQQQQMQIDGLKKTVKEHTEQIRQTELLEKVNAPLSPGSKGPSGPATINPS